MARQGAAGWQSRASTQYEGLGSLEFKWDAQGRRFLIIEPTVGRTDMQEEIPTLNASIFR